MLMRKERDLNVNTGCYNIDNITNCSHNSLEMK
jgi:hypothetical protein